ncbi:MAG TPA: TetR/AcrR family transcriptional regulator [Kribbella sp.]|nr:TetR/AcrR family transcriptional regulator [Kribbella sp.]
MSDQTPARKRRRRADADRSRAAILDAATTLLGEHPDASVETVAAAAGVTRQTVYAHFPSREGLLGAVVDRISAETIAAISAADLDKGSAADALLRLIDTSWRTFERYPLLLHPAASSGDAERHEPVTELLERLIRRGQTAGEFDRSLPVAWLVAATMALGHAAGEAVGAGRLTAEEATAALRPSLLRLFGVAGPQGRRASPSDVA